MIYTKPILQITWDDVESFCQQKIHEGAYLDYKQDFPSRLEKTIAAMANTLGGIILIGVAEDSENKPVTPVSGIEFQKGISERVLNIILTNIAPPVFPEIAVCSNSTGEKAVVVIRVPQSDQTPHAIAGSTEVYLRTGNRNKPETLARIDEIEWLQDKRKKSEELRENLFRRANERFNYLYNLQLEELKAKGQKIEKITKGWLTLSLCPYYPKDIFVDPPSLNNVYQDIRVRDYYRTDAHFPLPDKGMGKIAQDGILLYKVDSEGGAYHTELNCLGLYFYKQALLHIWNPTENNPQKVMRATEIFSRLDEFTDSAIKYYKKIGFQGILRFVMHLDNVHGCGLGTWSTDRWATEILYSPDPQIKYSNNLLAGTFEDMKSQLVFEAIQHIAWSFGWAISTDLLDSYYRQLKPGYK